MMKQTVEFRNGWNYDRDKVSRETGLKCEDPSLAVQSTKDEADINTIVRRFGITGILPQVLVPPTYGDFEAVMTYQDAQNLLIDARKSFEAMPAEVRRQFGNDPMGFVEFCSEPKNRPQMKLWGLVDEIAPVTPAVPVAAPVAS